MTVPHITIEQMEFIAQPWTDTAASVAEVNARIDAYNEKQAQPVSWNMKYADSTPKLSVGNSAFEDWFQAQEFATLSGVKQMCRDSYAAGMGDPLVTYANTQAQPEPSDPHAKLRAEYAKQVADGTTGFYLWEFGGNNLTWIKCDAAPLFIPVYEYRCTDISCMVALKGEPAKRMRRTEAQELQRSLGDTVEWSTPSGAADKFFETLLFNQVGTYTYAPKATIKPTWTGSREDVINLFKVLAKEYGL